jgi:hypothetical protein
MFIAVQYEIDDGSQPVNAWTELKEIDAAQQRSSKDLPP